MITHAIYFYNIGIVKKSIVLTFIIFSNLACVTKMVWHLDVPSQIYIRWHCSLNQAQDEKVTSSLKVDGFIEQSNGRRMKILSGVGRRHLLFFSEFQWVFFRNAASIC